MSIWRDASERHEEEAESTRYLRLGCISVDRCHERQQHGSFELFHDELQGEAS